jgi:hypothetical protein
MKSKGLWRKNTGFLTLVGLGEIEPQYSTTVESRDVQFDGSLGSYTHKPRSIVILQCCFLSSFSLFLTFHKPKK